MAARPLNAIDEIAFGWAAKLDRAPLDDQEQASLDAWMAADPRHTGAFARAMAANLYLDRAVALGPDFAADPRRAGWMSALAVSRRQMLAGGSALALTAIGGGITYALLQGEKRVATAKGVIQHYPLTDGSSMVLNTATKVELSFDAAARTIALVSGEARFDVVKDHARPFIVSAGDISVRAVGTSFSVWRQEDDSVHVTVSEGIVEIVRDGRVLLPRLTSGRMVRIGVAGPVAETALSPDALDHASAWTNGQIDMNGLSLGEAAAQYERYSDVRIEIDSPAVAALRVSGTYSINNPLGFARDAALSLGLETVPIESGVRIRAAG